MKRLLAMAIVTAGLAAAPQTALADGGIGGQLNLGFGFSWGFSGGGCAPGGCAPGGGLNLGFGFNWSYQPYCGPGHDCCGYMPTYHLVPITGYGYGHHAAEQSNGSSEQSGSAPNYQQTRHGYPQYNPYLTTSYYGNYYGGYYAPSYGYGW